MLDGLQTECDAGYRSGFTMAVSCQQPCQLGYDRSPVQCPPLFAVLLGRIAVLRTWQLLPTE